LPPREYQRLAAELAWRTKGMILADDVGLGKTCSALCLIADPATRPALVVTLTHLPRQWRAELAKFLPGLAVHIVSKGSPYDVQLHRGKRSPSFPAVLVLNYHKLAGWEHE